MRIRPGTSFPVALATVLMIVPPAGADDWPQWRGPNRDGVWRETGIVEKFSGPRLDPVWRVEIGPGYSGPTVADGRVYVTDRQIEPKQIERVHCFDAKSGRSLWSHVYDCPYRDVGYDAGPRASVTIDGDRAYALGTMGHFFCFDAVSGSIRWSRELKSEYNIEMPTWGLAAAPLIEDNMVILQIGGQPGACLVALDKNSGKEIWKSIEDAASYSAPIIIQHAGRRIVVCWTGNKVNGLDPKSGESLWSHPFPAEKMVIGISTPVHHRDHLFLTGFFDGAMLLRLVKDKQAVEPVWDRKGASEQETDGLHSIISTPYLHGDHIYGVDSYGELRCLELKSGDRVWEDLTATPQARWSTIHFVENSGKIWMFNERGELIISRLSPKGFEEISRAKLIDPTTDQLRQRGGVCWSHPAFANRHVFARNDRELLCANLSAADARPATTPAQIP